MLIDMNITATEILDIPDDNVALAMKHIFPAPEIYRLDIADGLKQLLYEKSWDMSFLLQSDAALVARELRIDEFVAKIIIDAAKRKALE
jgi:hypothetical protein